MSIATFPQPLYAKEKATGDQLIVLAVYENLGSEGERSPDIHYLVMKNQAEDPRAGVSFLMRKDLIIFEHFYWPEIEPVVPGDFQHPQEPALKAW